MSLKQAVLQVNRSTSPSAKAGLCTGFVIGLLILLYGSRLNPWMVLALCPTSIAGMALDNAPVGIAVSVGVAMTLIGNAVWYGFVFGLTGVLLRKKRASS